MSPFRKTALTSAAAMSVVTVCAALLLTLSNALLPKYIPKIDEAIVAVLNEMAPTGETDMDKLLGSQYFVLAMEAEGVEAWNKANGSAARRVLAVYKAAQGANAGVVFVETETIGYADSKVRLITAFNADGTLRGIYVRDMPVVNDWYSGDIEAINALIAGKTQISVNDLKPAVTDPRYRKGRAGATVTTNAFIYAVELAAAIFAEVTVSG